MVVFYKFCLSNRKAAKKREGQMRGDRYEMHNYVYIYIFFFSIYRWVLTVIWVCGFLLLDQVFVLPQMSNDRERESVSRVTVNP